MVRTAIYMTGIENYELTKEDLYYIEVVDRHERRLIVDTGFYYPEHFIERLAHEFPDLVIGYYHADKQLGINCGYGVVSDGIISHHNAEDDKMVATCYLTCYGSDPWIKINENNDLYIDWESEGELC